MLTTFEWQYVTVLYSNNAYGRAAFAEFMAIAEHENICIATQVKIEPYFADDAEAMNNVVKYYLLEGSRNASVAVMLTTDSDARAILAAVKGHLKDKTNTLVWVASDYWGSRYQVCYQ